LYWYWYEGVCVSGGVVCVDVSVVDVGIVGVCVMAYVGGVFDMDGVDDCGLVLHVVCIGDVTGVDVEVW